MTDYKSYFEAKSRQYEELSQQFTEYQQQSNLIINDLEEQLKNIKRKNQMLSRQIGDQKEKSKCFKSSIEREVEFAQKERNEFKKKFMEFEKKVIQLQIVNQNLESELRATKSTLSQYEQRTQKTMDELVMKRLQFEQSHQTNKEVVTRLRNQLKDAEEQLYAIHQIREKKQEEKEKKSSSHLGQSDICASEIITTNANAFKQTLKGIRQYMATLDMRKMDARKYLLKQ